MSAIWEFTRRLLQAHPASHSNRSSRRRPVEMKDALRLNILPKQWNGFRPCRNRNPLRRLQDLEHHFQCDLYVARVVASALDLPNRTPIEVVGYIPCAAVNRVVEHVEEIAAELGVDLLRSEFLPDTQVKVLGRRLAQRVVVSRFVSVTVREGLAIGFNPAGDKASVSGRRHTL